MVCFDENVQIDPLALIEDELRKVEKPLHFQPNSKLTMSVQKPLHSASEFKALYDEHQKDENIFEIVR